MSEGPLFEVELYAFEGASGSFSINLDNVADFGGTSATGRVSVGGAVAGRAIEKGSDGRNNVRCR